MSRREKLLERLLSGPSDFATDELETLMRQYGCRKSDCGKTSGSAIAYVHEASGRVLRMHSSHPRKVLKHYQVADVIEFLRGIGAVE